MFVFVFLTVLVIFIPASVRTQGINTDIEYASGSGSGNVVFVNQPVQLVEIASGGTPPYSYQWYVNDVKVEGANASNFTFVEATAGFYPVYCEVTDSLGDVGGTIPPPMFIKVEGSLSTSPSSSATLSLTPTASQTPRSSSSPTPSVPEFSWLAIVPLLLSLFSAVIIVRHREGSYD
jgi:hypothetical protein